MTLGLTRLRIAALAPALAVGIAASSLPGSAGATASAAPRPAAAHATARTLPVTGYAENGTDPSLVAASAAHLSTLGVDGINISADGASVPQPGAESLTLLRQARSRHLRAEILVGNFSDALGDFDSPAIHNLVSSPPHRRAVIRSLVRAVREQGWDGVQVDLEAIAARDRGGLTQFIAELRAAMPAGKSLSMAVTAFTTESEYVANGYDLTRLGRSLTRMVLMAYDEHGPTWNGVGPIGGLPWQEASLRLVLRHVPARKLDLGVAGYGYTWPTKGTGEQVGDAQARQMVADDHATAHWNVKQGEWTATLSDGTVMWWSDARSWPLRQALARRYGLHGMALWSLALSDPVTR